MDQFKEIPLLESLRNFQKDARNIRHMLQNVTTLPCIMANSVRAHAHLEFCRSQVKHSNKHVYRIVNYIEQLTVN